MAIRKNVFRPFVGRLFTLKNFTVLKTFPSVLLIMDETQKEVMFLDSEGNPTWIGKWFLRPTVEVSRVFAAENTIEMALQVIEEMRSVIAEDKSLDKNKIKELNAKVANTFLELRDLATRMQGVKFAPPEPTEETKKQ